jgi:hypothetical protein
MVVENRIRRRERRVEVPGGPVQEKDVRRALTDHRAAPPSVADDRQISVQRHRGAKRAAGVRGRRCRGLCLFDPTGAAAAEHVGSHDCADDGVVTVDRDRLSEPPQRRTVAGREPCLLAPGRAIPDKHVGLPPAALSAGIGSADQRVVAVNGDCIAKVVERVQVAGGELCVLGRARPVHREDVRRPRVESSIGPADNGDIAADRDRGSEPFKCEGSLWPDDELGIHESSPVSTVVAPACHSGAALRNPLHE